MDGRWLALLALLAGPVSAQQVYKCGHGAAVSYQSQPCADGKSSKTWDATPVPEPSNAELWRRYRIQKELDRRYAADRSAARASGVYVPAPQSGYGCESAKRQRAAVYEAAGNKRSFELSSQMDGQVQQACK